MSLLVNIKNVENQIIYHAMRQYCGDKAVYCNHAMGLPSKPLSTEFFQR